MSLRTKHPVRQRSTSAVRSAGNSPSYNRPRSMGFFSNSSPYTPYSSSPVSSYSIYNPSTIGNYNKYSSNYTSPYISNGYRNSPLNGYTASLSIPAKALNKISMISPSYSSNRDYPKTASNRQSRQMSRGNSFNRERSLSRSQSSVGGGMGSRSLSLTSLNSEGYCVRNCFYVTQFIIRGQIG